MPRPALAVALSLLLLSPTAQAAGPFRMGVHEPGLFNETPPVGLVALADNAHAGVLRGAVYWSRLVPGGQVKPAGFDARDPADPGYDWAEVDAFVRQATALGAQPLLVTLDAPNWAEGLNEKDRHAGNNEGGVPEGSYRPNPPDVGDFHHALARRYDGTFPDPTNPGQTLPRVRYFQVWNEPNFGEYLTVFDGGAPEHYALMLNAAYDAIKSAKSSNLVITAGMGPYGFNGHARDVDPQVFLRRMFCLELRGKTRGLRRASKCAGPRPRFDVLAQHPYTFQGTPTTKAYSPDGGGVGNMPEIRRILDYAVKSRRVLPSGSKALWVTEFSWYSNPPGMIVDSGGQALELGKPLPVQAAYLSETAYRLWRIGVGAFVWYSLRDLTRWPGGLYFDDNRAKPALRAFQFPFYVHRAKGRLTVWGNLQDGPRSRVAIERRSGRSWRRVAAMRTDQFGVLYGHARLGRGRYRARVLSGARKGQVSYPFSAR